MTNELKYIYPMMIELNKTVKDTVYYLALPELVKKKWIELERQSKSSYNPMYYLPTITLKRLFHTHLDGVVDLNPVSEQTDDSKWLVSFKNINIKVVVNCFKIWVEEFYINGALANNYKRKNGENDSVRYLAMELIELLKVENFGEVNSEEVTLFSKGKAVDNIGYQLYPLRIVNSLIGKSITINGIDTKLLYSNKNELVTNTRDFHNKNDYYSFTIQFSVQTLPPENKAYLNIDLSVRRWISGNEKGGHIYLPNDKNCYIRVKGDRMQVIQTVYNRELKENVWKRVDERCFKETQVSGELHKFTDVLDQPEEFNHGKIGDILIPYEEGINGIDTSVRTGVSFHDRQTIFNYISNHIYHLDEISANVQAVKIKKKVQNKKENFAKDPININSIVFLNQLDKALNGETLTIEIFAASTIRDALIERLNQFMDNNTKHELKCYEINFLHKELDKTPMSKKENLPGFEKRVEEIVRELKPVNKPTLAIVAIHDREYYRKLDYKINVDPKEANRCGFALTGRLTQFITFEEFEKELLRIEKSDEQFERKKKALQDRGKKIQARSKTDLINKAINGAILDSFRQLGVVFDYGKNKHLKGKKITGVHICNYKKTKYGTIHPFPIIVTYDVDYSTLKVYSDLIDKVEIPYWQGILALSKLAAERNVSKINKSISSTSIYRRLERIITQEESDTVIIFDANGTSRNFVKGIANSKIESADKNLFNQSNRMFINDNRFIDFHGSSKNLSVIRLRHNKEVCSYFPMDNPSEKYKFKQVSGLFKYNNVYYSLDGRPSHENKTYDKLNSKTNSSSSFSHRNMIEIYPIYVSGDEKNHRENEEIAVGIVDMLREASIQYTAQKTVLPLPLHLAVKMEEYL